MNGTKHDTEAAGIRNQELVTRKQGSGSRDQEAGIRKSGLGIRDQGRGIRKQDNTVVRFPGSRSLIPIP